MSKPEWADIQRDILARCRHTAFQEDFAQEARLALHLAPSGCAWTWYVEHCSCRGRDAERAYYHERADVSVISMDPIEIDLRRGR